MIAASVLCCSISDRRHQLAAFPCALEHCHKIADLDAIDKYRQDYIAVWQKCTVRTLSNGDLGIIEQPVSEIFECSNMAWGQSLSKELIY